MRIDLDVIWETDLNEHLGEEVPADALPPFDLFSTQIGSKDHNEIIAKQWDKWMEDVPKLREARAKFRYPDLNSVSIGPDGTVFAGDSGRAAVWKLGPDGRVVEQIVTKTTREQRKAFLANKDECRPEFFSSVDRLSVDKEGNIVFFDDIHSRIVRMTADRRLTARPATFADRFTIDDAGRLWVSDRIGKIEILEFPKDDPPVVTSAFYWQQPSEGKDADPVDGMIRIVAGRGGLMHAVPDSAPFRLLTFQGEKWTSHVVRDPHCDKECEHGKSRPHQHGSRVFTPLLNSLAFDRTHDLLFAKLNGRGTDLLDSSGRYVGRADPSRGELNHTAFDSEGFLYEVDSSLTSRKSRVVKYAYSIVQ